MQYKILSLCKRIVKEYKKIDIGILDIAMNEINGIKLGRKLKEKFPQDILYFEYIKRQRRVALNCRGYLVNLCHIAKIKGYILYLDNGQELPIAQKRMEGFRLKINTFLQSNL